jgi:nucleotide-binding universal stress UspA family protein
MFQKILVAHDGSTGAQKAMAVAIDLAQRFGAEIHLISVIEELPKYAATIDEVQR